VRTEVCMCGLEIRARSLSTCREAVEEHNKSMCHQLWRAFREGWLLGSTEGPTVPQVARDLSGATPNASAPPLSPA